MKKILLLIIILFAVKSYAIWEEDVAPDKIDYENLFKKISKIEWIKNNLDIKYCIYDKAIVQIDDTWVENYTFTVFKRHSCSDVNGWDGKKITYEKYLSLNPNFHNGYELTCMGPIKLSKQSSKCSNCYYIDVINLYHTPSDKIYFISRVGIDNLDKLENSKKQIKVGFYKGFYNHSTEVYRRQNPELSNFKFRSTKPIKEGDGTVTNSNKYDYFGITIDPMSRTASGYSSHVSGEIPYKCFASDDYWDNMYKEKYIVSKEKKQDKVEVPKTINSLNEGEFLVKLRGSIYDLNNKLLVDTRKGDRVCLCTWDSEENYHSVCSVNNELIGIISARSVGNKMSEICNPVYALLSPEEEKEAIRIAKGKEEETPIVEAPIEETPVVVEVPVEETPSSKPPEKDEELFIIGSGTGFFVNDDGYIATNEHVAGICQMMASIINGEPYQFKILVTDKLNDLALLKGDYKNNNYLSINSSGADFGEDIVAFGYPLSEQLSSSVKLTRGIVSSLSGPGNNIAQIQIDAAIQPGNSGGPVLNYSGQVIGVASSGLNKVAMLANEDAPYIPENVNFAVAAPTLSSFLKANQVKIYNETIIITNTKELAKVGMPSTIQLFCLNTKTAHQNYKNNEQYNDVLLKKVMEFK